jgi:hypothetical protein
MLNVEEWLLIRDLYSQGLSISEISRRTGYARETVRTGSVAKIWLPCKIKKTFTIRKFNYFHWVEDDTLGENYSAKLQKYYFHIRTLSGL